MSRADRKGKPVGFRRKPKTYRLRFEDPDLDGLVVTARSLPIGTFLEVTELSALPQDDPASAKAASQMIRVFAGSLVEWNLEDEHGDPVPATYEGVCTQELDFVMTIITAWMQAMADVNPNLPQTSRGGPNALEASLPMASPSPSQPS